MGSAPRGLDKPAGKAEISFLYSEERRLLTKALRQVSFYKTAAYKGHQIPTRGINIMSAPALTFHLRKDTRGNLEINCCRVTAVEGFRSSMQVWMLEFSSRK